MQDAKVRPGRAVRIVTGFVVVCGAFAAVPASAQAPRGGQSAAGQGAAIIYSGPAAASATLTSTQMPVLPPPSVAPGVFSDPTVSSTVSKPGAPSLPASRPLDIRPGAFKSSYGPMPSTLAKPAAPAPAGLTSRPIAAPTSSAAMAQPYAGAPYQVEGKWFVPMNEPNYDEVGTASWYGPNFHGKAAATGETYDQMAMTAAHPTLPIPSLVRVTNLENGKSVVVRLNDRGPFVDDRIIDMSKGAAQALDMTGKGTARVRVKYVGPAPAAANATPAAVSYTSAAEPAAASASGNDFYLQTGAFSDLANAYALRDKVAAVGPVSIVEGQANGQRLYRVLVGPFVSRDEAERSQDKMANSGMKALIVARK